MKTRIMSGLGMLLTFFAPFDVDGQSAARLTGLQNEHLENPMGIDNPSPRLSWRMEDDRTGAKQLSYRLWVGSDSTAVANGHADMWDTGEVRSDDMLVVYGGKPLAPFTKYYWRVEGTDMEEQSLLSPIASFETGMMQLANWHGAWIGDGKDIHYTPAPYFRKTFQTDKEIRSARIYIAVGGLYDLYVNGERIGDHAGFAALDDVDLVGLVFDGKIAVQHTDAAVAGHGDGHLGFGHGVHCGGNHRGLHRDVAGEMGGCINFRGNDIGLVREQQDVIISQSQLLEWRGKWIVVVVSCVIESHKSTLWVTHDFDTSNSQTRRNVSPWDEMKSDL